MTHGAADVAKANHGHPPCGVASTDGLARVAMLFARADSHYKALPGCEVYDAARDAFGGFTLVIDQNWWGHRAQKRTRLYVVGCKPIEVPPLPLVLGEATHTVGLWSGRDKENCRPSIAKHEYESTPPELASWLVALARRCARANAELNRPQPENQRSTDEHED